MLVVVVSVRVIAVWLLFGYVGSIGVIGDGWAVGVGCVGDDVAGGEGGVA